ncbi:TAXI family TRAP transporter solute-binding subunit [Phytoactinopolyspora halotolerans]|uniref:TAXI family TRAP transporter solute-binding subunit n=1 Tax=Phytoactinopolyspora halotolerans TaxID=1981512 RepID=A0A6L9S3F6_9ACTN|nr:TAXI family TRAP transporter solute-binding subunit [Phytoactinopolyspora halotolerans]NED99705.1 TAXI family TRAP transporter solute-binding subunit [Phytoactinopolyspora halotolerans]
MRPRHRYAACIGTVTAGLVLAACSQPANSSDDDDGESGSLSIATGTTSGLYYPIGGAMAEIIKDSVDGVNASAESTGASVENIRLLDAGDSDLAIAQGDVVYQAYHGDGEFSDAAVETNTLMVLYPNVYHAVSLAAIDEDLGLDCFGDVAGHRFSVGAPGSGNELATNLVFDALGMSTDSDISRQRYAYAETARALREGQLDAGSWVVGEGHGSLSELEATDPIHLIPMCDDEVAAVTDQYPFYTPHTISADTYSTIDDDVSTIALWNVVSVSSDMSEDRGYELASALYENVETISQVYAGAADYLTLETLENSPVPLHPGLIRYAEEQGVEIPDELRP